MKKKFLFSMLAILLAGFGFGGVSLADACDFSYYDSTTKVGIANNETSFLNLLNCAEAEVINLSDSIEISANIDAPTSVGHTNGLIIDLKGHSITSQTRGAGDDRHYYIALYGNVDIRGNGGSISVRLLDIYGNLTFTSGTIDPTDTELEGTCPGANCPGGAGFWINGGASAVINGGTINGHGRQAIVIDPNASVIINDGNLSSVGSYAVINKDNSTLTINGGTITANYTVTNSGGTLNLNGGTIISNGAGNVIENIEGTMTMTGGIIQGGSVGIFTIGNGTAGSATVTINGGEIKDFVDFGISGNGTIGSGGTVITISDVEINADGEGNLAIYHPQSGEMTIGGGTFKGKESAIEIRAGNLTINGGDFESTANSFSINGNGNGTTTEGVAVAVSQHTTDLPINVTINGGTFAGIKALYEEDVQNDLATDNITISVTSGTFSGEVFSENNDNFIAGGKYSTSPNSGYLANGKSIITYATDATTPYHVGEKVTVTLNANGGTVTPATLDLVKGDLIPNGAISVSSCYNLDGWYKDESLSATGAWDFATDTVNTGITLYAKWGSYVCGGGSSSSSRPSNNTSSNTGNNNTGTNNTGTVNTGTVNTGTVNTGTVETGTNNEETANQEELKNPEQQDWYDNNGDQQEVLENGLTREMNNAYEFAYRAGITTMETIEDAKMEEGLTRIAMAKMLSQYAINVLGKTPADIEVPVFVDVPADLDAQYDNGVTLAYKLGIMGQNMPNNKFLPNDLVTRAQFGTALSRLLFGIEDGEDAYYTTHLAKLKDAGIISNDDPTLEELRGYVMLMLMRSAK